MPAHRHKLLFLLFFISGFCGLLYQVVWTRLAFAAFGIITPVLSIVISVFMLGLGLGAWAAETPVRLTNAATDLPAAQAPSPCTGGVDDRRGSFRRAATLRCRKSFPAADRPDRFFSLFIPLGA